MTECPVCQSDRFDPIYDNPVWGIKFSNAFIDSILEFDKTETLRYELEREFGIGDIIALQDEDGNDFAWAKVVSITEMPAKAVVQCEFEGHTNYRSMKDLALSLRQFYPHAYIGPETPLTLVSFQVVKEVER